jgi:hypothetical protein
MRVPLPCQCLWCHFSLVAPLHFLAGRQVHSCWRNLYAAVFLLLRVRCLAGP